MKDILHKFRKSTHWVILSGALYLNWSESKLVEWRIVEVDWRPTQSLRDMTDARGKSKERARRYQSTTLRTVLHTASSTGTIVFATSNIVSLFITLHWKACSALILVLLIELAPDFVRRIANVNRLVVIMIPSLKDKRAENQPRISANYGVIFGVLLGWSDIIVRRTSKYNVRLKRCISFYS